MFIGKLPLLENKPIGIIERQAGCPYWRTNRSILIMQNAKHVEIVFIERQAGCPYWGKLQVVLIDRQLTKFGDKQMSILGGNQVALIG